MNDLTVGSIRKHIIQFAIPVLVTNMIQLAYILINRIWAGKILGNDAIAVVTIASVIIYAMFSFSIGLSIGVSTITGQYFGAKKMARVKRTVGTAFLLTTILAIIMTVVIQILNKPILELLQTPQSIMATTQSYMNWISYGFIFLFLQLLITFLFRSIGNTKYPLIASTISMVVNAALDPFLMLGIGPFPKMGVDGAALGFVTANFVAFAIGLYLLKKHGKVLDISWKRFFKIDPPMIKAILKIGAPTGFQNVIISLGLTIGQFFIDKSGTDAVAAYGAVSMVANIVLYYSWSISAAISAITAQNIGAEKIKRAVKALRQGYALMFYFTLIVVLISMIKPEWLLVLFLKENGNQAFEIGKIGLRSVSVSYLFMIMLISYDSFYNGAGDTMAAMMITLFGTWVIRIPMMWCLDKFYGVEGIWLALGLSNIVSGVVSFFYFRSGRWKNKSVMRQKN